MTNLNRRSFFHRVTDGLHGAALTALLSRDVFGRESLAPPTRRVYDLKPRPPHYPPRAKSVIQLFMNGGPSQVDLFDPKPMLDRHHGKPYFQQIAEDVSSPQSAGGLMRSPFKFAQHGESGIWQTIKFPVT